jgi:hypothetical protein
MAAYAAMTRSMEIDLASFGRFPFVRATSMLFFVEYPAFGRVGAGTDGLR